MQDSITHEALEASDTRQALEEAFKVIHPAPRPIRHAYQPDGSHWPGDGIGPYTEEYGAWSKALAHFRRFPDAEAWTDAAMCLVPEGCGIEILTGSNELPQFIAHSEMPAMARVFFLSKGIDADGIADHPALALAQACLKARENGDG